VFQLFILPHVPLILRLSVRPSRAVTGVRQLISVIPQHRHVPQAQPVRDTRPVHHVLLPGIARTVDGVRRPMHVFPILPHVTVELPSLLPITVEMLPFVLRKHHALTVMHKVHVDGVRPLVHVRYSVIQHAVRPHGIVTVVLAKPLLHGSLP